MSATKVQYDPVTLRHETTAPGISVVLPIYEEQGAIGTLLDDLVDGLSATGSSFEVVAVDDGSADGTLDQLKAAQRRHPGAITIARHIVNRGNGAALRTGIRLARGGIVVTMDADGQHEPAYIQQLVAEIPPYDLVIGARTEAYRGPRLRGWANGAYNRFASWLTRREIADLTSGFRAMRRHAVGHFLPLFPDGFSAPTTTTLAFLKAGYNVQFIPVDVQPRTSGESKINLWSDGARFGTIILRMVMLYDPLRIFAPVAAILVGLGVAAWIAGVWNASRLVLPNAAIFLLLSALTTWLLGLVSDQVANTRVQYHGDETIEVIRDSESSTGSGY